MAKGFNRSSKLSTSYRIATRAMSDLQKALNAKYDPEIMNEMLNETFKDLVPKGLSEFEMKAFRGKLVLDGHYQDYIDNREKYKRLFAK